MAKMESRSMLKFCREILSARILSMRRASPRGNRPSTSRMALADGGDERLFVKAGPHFPGQWD